jgi:hemolysin III
MFMKKSEMDQMISAHDSNETVNAISHLAGAIAALGGLALLVVLAAARATWVHVVCFSIYGTSLFFSMFASYLLHSNLRRDRYSRALGIFDHATIYVLIAGSYTPLCVLVLGGWLGWGLLAFVWTLAIVFAALKILYFTRISPNLSLASYLFIGWPGVLFGYYIYQKLSLGGLLVLLVSGLFYTVGSVIFNSGKPNPWPPNFGYHEIWHVMVLAGNAAMYALMFFYVLPYGG